MDNPTRPSIPIELMELLNRINDNVNQVKERLSRLEAQNHNETFKTIFIELEKERDKRVKLEIDLASIKTKLAPIVVAISLAGAAGIEFLVKAIH